MVNAVKKNIRYRLGVSHYFLFFSGLSFVALDSKFSFYSMGMRHINLKILKLQMAN